MLLTITTTHRPASDLGFLLHKNPGRMHEAELGFGKALLFYPEVSDERCTMALVLDVDPVSLVRGKGRDARGQGDKGLLDQYVNDRPYVASSFLSVAIAKTLRNALGGTSKERQALADTPIALEARVLPLPIRGSEELIGRLFRPLGYEIEAAPIALDAQLAYLGPEWDRSPYVSLKLSGTCRLRDLLAHLYVLIPVLDKRKHYYVDRHELEKLLAKGEGWLGAHPERELIAHRYLRFKRSWTREVLARLADDAPFAEDEDRAGAAEAAATGDEDTDTGKHTSLVIGEPKKDAAEAELEKPIRLHDQRLDMVAGVLKDVGARRVVDLGCGSGKLLQRLLSERQFTEILGVDVSSLSLEAAERRLKLDSMSERERNRIGIVQGALTYRDRRIEGFDAAALIEVIEHLDEDRLAAMERAVFEFAKPDVVVVTTPNGEYNVRFEGLRPGEMRHADHRFEWSRAEFSAWAEPVAARFGYDVQFQGIGEEDAVLGAPSQMAVFTRVHGSLGETGGANAGTAGQ